MQYIHLQPFVFVQHLYFSNIITALKLPTCKSSRHILIICVKKSILAIRVEVYSTIINNDTGSIKAQFCDIWEKDEDHEKQHSFRQPRFLEVSSV